MINREKEEITAQVSSGKFFLLVGYLVHFCLCFRLHISELLKLYGIILLSKLIIKTDESRYTALFVVSGSIKKFFSIDCVNLFYSINTR